MTTCPDFLVVSEHAARNPVARAVQRSNLRQAMRDFQIRLHTMADGECAAADGQAAAKVLAVAIRLCEQRGAADTPECRVMRGGLECLVQLAERRWRWREADAAAVDVALTRAQESVNRATAVQLQDAHRYVLALEREVEARREPA